MEPPTKRLKFDASFYTDDEEEQDELSLTPAQFDTIQDPLYQLDKKRAKSATKLKTAYESLFEKYGKDSHVNDDVINFYTDEIEEDNGHIKSLEEAGEDCLSSDEEESIDKQKTQGKTQSKSQRRPLTSTSSIADNHLSHSQPPWNPTLTLGAYQLSSAFPRPPYSVNPPFDFGGSLFGNGQVDPVWEAPDLPPQPLHTQYGSPSGMGGSQERTKRFVNAKSFLQRDMSNPEASGDGSEDDELLLASNEQKASSDPPSRNPETPATTGISGVEAEGGVITDDLPIQANRDITEPNTERNQKVEAPLSSSFSRRGRRRPKKSGTHKSIANVNIDPKSEHHALQAHEKRIEVIIPMMKRILSQEISDAASNQAAIGSTESSSGLHSNASSQTSSQEGDASHQLFHSSRCIDKAHLTQDKECENPESSQPQPQKSQKRRRSETQKRTSCSSTSALSEQDQDKDNPEKAHSEERQKLEAVESSSHGDTVTENLPTVEQDSSRGNKDDKAVSDRQSPTLSAPGQLEEQVPCITSIDMTIEPLVVSNPVADPPQRPLSTEESSGNKLYRTTESLGSATADTSLSESATYDPEASHGSEPDDSPADRVGGDDPSYVLAQEILASNPHGVQICDVVQVSEEADTPETQISFTETDIVSRSPELPPLRNTVESVSPQNQNCLPMLEASDTPEIQAFGGLEQALSAGVPILELDDLRLDSEPREAQRSPSLGAKELPGDTTTVELALRLSSFPTENSEQRPDAVYGRSPSPELGTPTRSNRAHSAASKKLPRNPTTPTKTRNPKSPKSRGSRRRTPSTKRFPLTSLLPSGIDDESDDELSMVSSIRSTTSSRAYSPFSRTGTPSLPPLPSTSHKKTRKNNLFIRTPSSYDRTPTRILGLGENRNLPPATDLRTRARKSRSRPVHSSPLARTVAERLLSSPTRKQRPAVVRSPSLVSTPRGTLRRCGEDGFSCGRDFCFTCCI